MFFATLRLLFVLFFRFLGRCCYYCFKKRRNIALDNVRKSYASLFPGEIYSERNVRRVVKKSFMCLGQNVADFFLLRKYTPANIDRYVQAKNLDYVSAAYSSGKGVIVSTAHFGSWELAAHYLAQKGFKSLIIYNNFFKNRESVDVWVKKQRETSGNTLLLKKNSFLSLFKHLKRGGAVTLVTDQHAFPPEGIKMTLLGQAAWTHATFVKLSLRTGAPIVPAFMFGKGTTLREGTTFGKGITFGKGLSSYTIEFGEPIDPAQFQDHPDPVYAMTAKCNEALEAAIVRAPELWMWQHRRFKAVD